MSQEEGVNDQPGAIIVSANAFQYGWMGSTNRTLLIAKALESCGFCVSIFAGGYIDREQQGAIDNYSNFPIYRTESYGPYSKLMLKSKILRSLRRVLLRLGGADKYWSAISFGWSSKVSDDELDLAVECLGTPSIVWSVSGGLLEGPTVGDRLAQRTGAAWICEMHDPPIGCGVGVKNHAISTHWESLMGRADLVVVNSCYYKQHLCERYMEHEQKIKLLPMSFQSRHRFKNDSKGKAKKSNDLIVGYFGSLAGGRSILPFIRAYLLSDIYNLHGKGLTLRLAGIGRGFREALRLSKDQLNGVTIEYYGSVDRDQVDRLIANCDLLLVVQPEELVFEVPGKTFNLLSTGKRVMALAGHESETARVVSASPLGVVFSHQDERGMALWIKARQGGFEVSSEERQAADKYMDSYSPENLCVRLSALIAELPGVSVEADRLYRAKNHTRKTGGRKFS